MKRAILFFRNLKNSQNWSNNNLTAKMPKTPVIAFHSQNSSMSKMILAKLFEDYNMYEKDNVNISEQEDSVKVTQLPSNNEDIFNQLKEMKLVSNEGMLIEEFPKDIESAEKFENEMDGLNLFINFTINDSGKYLVYENYNHKFDFFNNEEDIPSNKYYYS